MTELRIESLYIPGARLERENPLPFFRDKAVDLSVDMLANVPPEKRKYFGWQAGFRVLPYRMQDRYTRQRKMLTFQTAVLENEYLRAVFLLEMGGRLLSLYYKPLERELLHCNPVFQPANLAIRNAWFSGGIEWNIGQFGHTFNTCSPVFASAIQGIQGEPGLRIYEYERCKSLFWQIDFYLPPGLPFLVAYTRVVNPNNSEIPMYWWTNIAANEAPGTRVLAPAAQALYMDFNDGKSAFGITELPGLPSLAGADGTYSLNSTFANEFFFQCDSTVVPWQAALDRDGQGLIEASTARLKYRKLFCWGTHTGGRHWQEFLSEPGQAYLEIQAGLAPTQLHGLPMPAQTSWDWTQIFGYLEADPNEVHSPNWPSAVGSVERALFRKMSSDAIYQLEENCREKADKESHVLLQVGSGWGALEIKRRSADATEHRIPDSFFFPKSSMGLEQEKWLHLLERKSLPSQSPKEMPGEWMVQAEWEMMLENTADRDWYTWLHLGVMRMERFDENGAEAAWNESIRLRPTAWAYRNLAVLQMRQQDTSSALANFSLSWEMAVKDGCQNDALAVEVMQALVSAEKFADAMQVYHDLPADLRDHERVQILRAQAALGLNELDIVDEVLLIEFAGVREGETVLSDLWFETKARRESILHGEPLDHEFRQKIRANYSPPARIDFRSIDA